MNHPVVEYLTAASASPGGLVVRITVGEDAQRTKPAEGSRKLGDWRTSAEVRSELRIGARTLERWCKRKLIPFVKRGRKRLFFMPDVNAALRANGLVERRAA